MKRNRGFTLIELMIVICIMCIIISIIMPSFMRARSMAQYTGCQSNLKSIATAVELYATESESRYPTSIDVLPPQFIGHLPTCPSCQLGYSYTYTTVPDAYTVWCGTAQAHSMAGVQDGYPQYYSAHGATAK